MLPLTPNRTTSNLDQQGKRLVSKKTELPVTPKISNMPVHPTIFPIPKTSPLRMAATSQACLGVASACDTLSPAATLRPVQDTTPTATTAAIRAAVAASSTRQQRRRALSTKRSIT